MALMAFTNWKPEEAKHSSSTEDIRDFAMHTGVPVVPIEMMEPRLRGYLDLARAQMASEKIN
jgi:hypothetical protein